MILLMPSRYMVCRQHKNDCLSLLNSVYSMYVYNVSMYVHICVYYESLFNKKASDQGYKSIMEGALNSFTYRLINNKIRGVGTWGHRTKGPILLAVVNKNLTSLTVSLSYSNRTVTIPGFILAGEYTLIKQSYLAYYYYWIIMGWSLSSIYYVWPLTFHLPMPLKITYAGVRYSHARGLRCVNCLLHTRMCVVNFLDNSQGCSCIAGRRWQCSSGHRELGVQGSVISETDSSL